jgi:hypothetical protein
MTTQMKYPKTWKWDADGDSVEGVLSGLRYAKSKFGDEPVPVLTIVSNGENISVWLPGGLMRRVSDSAPKYGDIIKIHRGDLVPFGNEGRTYRAWEVDVVRKEGEYVDFSGPGLPVAQEVEVAQVDDSDIPF